MSGVPVWRGGSEAFREWPHEQGYATHVVYTREEAESLERVARASDLFVRSPDDDAYRESLIEALEHLDALRGGAS